MDINKLFIIIVIIVIASASVSYFQGIPLTGQATGTITKISVTPTSLTQEDREITVKITPGSSGADAFVYIHKAGEDTEKISSEATGVRVYSRRYCKGVFICKETKTAKFTFGSDDEGKYYATVRDCSNLVAPEDDCKYSGKYVKAFFTVSKPPQLTERPRLFNIPIRASSVS